MSEKSRLPEYDPPPMYTPSDSKRFQSDQQPVLMADAQSVFHDGARFNEFAKPRVPPPPPGCEPNHIQQMQMEKGQFEVIFNSSKTVNHHFNGGS